MSEQELTDLCVALEQGHLAQLTELDFRVESIGSESVFRRLAVALCGQLTDLSTESVELMQHLPYFKQLRSVWLDMSRVQADKRPGPMLDLCKLPKLRDFHLSSDDLILGFENSLVFEGFPERGSSLDRRWFISSRGPYRYLAGLPLENYQTFAIYGGLSPCTGTDLDMLKHVLQHHADKVVLWPIGPRGKHTLEVNTLSPEALQLVERLQGASKLRITSCVELQLLPALWNVLPAFVRRIELEFHRGPIWHGLPVTVAEIELYACFIYTSDLRGLISTAPQHVKVFTIVPSYWMKALTIDQLVDCIPPHLTVELNR